MIVFGLLVVLVSAFRLVGYSINYFISNIIVLLVVQILGGELDFIYYALIQFLFPRLLWISDRLSTTTDYSHTEYGLFNNTDVYIRSAMDWWGSADSGWNLIPLQIVISCLFFICGSITIGFSCSFEPNWLMILYVVLSAAVNVVFDLFVFRRVDEALDGVSAG